MECVNSRCTKREQVKELFHVLEKAEDFPSFCPYCQATLHRTIDGTRIDNLNLRSKALEIPSGTGNNDLSEEKYAKGEVLESQKGSEEDSQNPISNESERQTAHDHSTQSHKSAGKNNNESFTRLESPKDATGTAFCDIDRPDARTNYQTNSEKQGVIIDGDNETVLPSAESSTLPKKEHISLSKCSDSSLEVQNTLAQVSQGAENNKEQSKQSHQSFTSSADLVENLLGEDKESTEDKKAPVDLIDLDHETSHNSDKNTELHDKSQSLIQSSLLSSNNVSSNTKDRDNLSGISEKTPLEQDSDMTPQSQAKSQSRQVCYPPGHDLSRKQEGMQTEDKQTETPKLKFGEEKGDDDSNIPGSSSRKRSGDSEKSGNANYDIGKKKQRIQDQQKPENIEEQSDIDVSMETTQCTESWSKSSTLMETNHSLQRTTHHVTSLPITNWKEEECVTIVFYALLSPEFNFQLNKQNVTVYLDLNEVGVWSHCTDMFDARQAKGNFIEVQGKVQLPVRLLSQPISYKYAVINIGGKVELELSEYFEEDPERIVNRCLIVPENDMHPNAVWHQYDGVVYRDISNSRWNNLKNWVPGLKNKLDQGKAIKNREHAAVHFFPKWEGFVTGKQIDKITASEAIDRMEQIEECLAHQWISIDNNPIEKTLSSKEFPFEKVLKEFLTPKISHNARLKEDELKTPDDRRRRLISSLTITNLVWVFDLDFSCAELTDIIHCFVLETHGNDRCDFDDIHLEFPEDSWGDLSKSVAHLLNAAALKQYGNTKFYCPDVILAVPLLHFLRKDTKPFDHCNDDSDVEKSVERWCHSEGLPQFNPCKRLFEAFFSKVQPMFALDPYLRRLFLYNVSFEDFDKMCIQDEFPIHEICTALGFKIQNEDQSSLTSKLKLIEKPLSVLVKRLKKELRQRRKHLDSEVNCQAKSAYFLAEELVKKDSTCSKSMFLCVEIVSLILSSAQQLDDETSTSGSQTLECDVIFNSLTNSIETSVENCFPSKLSPNEHCQKEELKVWTTYLETDSLNGKLKDKWCKTLLSHFVKRLKKLNHNDSIDLYCRVNISADNINQSIVDAITNHAFNEVKKAIESGKTEGSIAVLRKKCLIDHVSSRAGELLSRMIIECWKKDEVSLGGQNLHTQLMFILTWKHWPVFIRSFGSAESQKILTTDAAKLIQSVVDHLCDIQSAIEDRSIDVQTITSLNQHQDNFIKLCTALTEIGKDSEKSKGFKEAEMVMKELEKRKEELLYFHDIKSQVGNFLNMCRSTKEAKFDTADLQRMYECDISEIEMKDICRRDSMSEGCQENQITVILFVLPDSLRSELTQLSMVWKSDIFQKFWMQNSRSAFKERQTNNHDEKGLTLADIQKNVFQPSLETWKQLALKLNDGVISLREVDKYFTLKNVQKEVEIMFSSLKITKNEATMRMDERLQQIERYRSFQGYIEATETVWEFKETLQLKGDFEIVKQLRNQNSNEFRENTLNVIDSSLRQVGENLQRISIEEAHCLQAVIDCEPLVKWLRETIKDTRALSTLVDLAMISAGENDLEVDRISNFHSSCLNFAPLIFDIYESNIGFDDLMKACQQVWKALKSDRHLPEKLRESCLHLDWLKAVQSSHGSVEMSSLMQTKIINSSGVYRIGHIAQSLDFKNGLEEVLTLTVPMDERLQDAQMKYKQKEYGKEEEDMKTYSFNDLKTLQSKLMLIAGKTSQLRGKDRKFSLDSTEEINRFVEIFEAVNRLGQVYIDLCEAGNVKYLDWSETIDCSEERDCSVRKKLANTCKEMEERLFEWRRCMHDTRHKYKEFNHFSTQQILIMRRELGSLRHAGASSTNLPLHVLTLLESVLSGITNQDLVKVLNKISGFSLVATDSSSSYFKTICVYVLAGIWLIYILLSLLYTSCCTFYDKSDQSKNEDNSEVNIEYDPYLTLEELGTVLVELGTLANEPSERRFPEYLKNDQPNLILVQSIDVYPTVLTLYMQHGENSLPTPNEVLLCTSETTVEEVELFWWRAFQDPYKQIFCLVNPDVLDYNVSQTSVAVFNTLKQKFGCIKELRVVIICSTENEDRSHIIAALDEYRLGATLSCAPGDILKSYLEDKLTTTRSRDGYYKNKKIEWIPAACLDEKRLSVRVISSERAGVGKSLVVTRLCEKLMRLPNNERMSKIRKRTEQLNVTVPLHGSVADTRQILDALWQHPLDANLPLSRIIHLDVSPSINKGLGMVLFNLVVLGVLQDTTGRLWRRKSSDLYIIERTKDIDVKVASDANKSSFVSLLPTTDCITPIQTVQLLNTPNISTLSPLFDTKEFSSEPVQRAFQYLFQLDRGQSLDQYQYDQGRQMGTPSECLALVIRYCGISDPSWSELKHFIDFLNSQLHDCEQSYFTNPANFDDQWMHGTLQGLKSFVVRFMITMSRDFATSSMDNIPSDCSANNIDEDIRPLQLRRRWESSAHPYIFFNQDRITMTFLGFHVQSNGSLIDPDTGIVIEEELMTKQLQNGLAHQKVDFNPNYNSWTK
ncbi:E3 ubiquitin-protein ligase rnf213-alpha isoform X2 [Exaiptasia diaphana]|uniref:E3 ubiquitin-protein ligase rnf213-alpha-like n=1 Tax=Exaiptasia diaphana TaxID=2652724 RepID=A0A913Y194_EXADI|nr:E3 ubiquitin-protein ligase rnf213-alpha isoform X2 [Exaiptasia diaphana]